MSEDLNNNQKENPLDVNQRKFMATFEDVVRKNVPGLLEKIEDEGGTILDIGFGGTGTEFVPLIKKYPNAEIFGIEQSKDAITLEDIVVQIGRSVKNVSLFKKSAEDESSFVDDKGNIISADVVIMRSPDIHRQHWERIIKNAHNHLKTPGIIYMTLNNESELETAKKIFAGNSISYRAINNPNPDEDSGYFSELYIITAVKNSG